MLLQHLIDSIEELVTFLNSTAWTDSPGIIWGKYDRVATVASRYQEEHSGLFSESIDNGLPESTLAPPLTTGTAFEIRWRKIKLLRDSERDFDASQNKARAEFPKKCGRRSRQRIDDDSYYQALV
jgi:hypothetical protein